MGTQFTLFSMNIMALPKIHYVRRMSSFLSSDTSRALRRSRTSMISDIDRQVTDTHNVLKAQVGELNQQVTDIQATLYKQLTSTKTPPLPSVEIPSTSARTPPPAPVDPPVDDSVVVIWFNPMWLATWIQCPLLYVRTSLFYVYPVYSPPPVMSSITFPHSPLAQFECIVDNILDHIETQWVHIWIPTDVS